MQIGKLFKRSKRKKCIHSFELKQTGMHEARNGALRPTRSWVCKKCGLKETSKV